MPADLVHDAKGRACIAVLPLLPKPPLGVDSFTQKPLRGDPIRLAEGLYLGDELFHARQYGV